VNAIRKRQATTRAAIAHAEPGRRPVPWRLQCMHTMAACAATMGQNLCIDSKLTLL
jgi:hypothetical protein